MTEEEWNNWLAEGQAEAQKARTDAVKERAVRMAPPKPSTQKKPSPPEEAAPPSLSNTLKNSGIPGLKQLGAVLGAPTSPQAAGAAIGIARGVPNAVGSVIDFAADVGRTVGDHVDPQFYRKIKSTVAAAGVTPLATVASPVGALLALGDQDRKARTDYAGMLSAKSTLGKMGDAKWNQGAADLAALVVGGEVLGIAKGFKALKAAGPTLSAMSASTRYALAGGVTLDPYSDRLGDALESFGVTNEFLTWTAQDDDDGAWEGRIKNVIEGAATGLPIDAVMGSLRWARSLIRDTPDEAALKLATEKWDELLGDAGRKVDTEVITADPKADAVNEWLNRAAASARTSEARAKAALRDLGDIPLDEEDLAEQVASRQLDAAIDKAAGKAPKVSPDEAIAADVNGLLSRAGAKEIVTPDTLALDARGKVVVSQQTKALMDEKGYADAFTSPQFAAKEGTRVLKVRDRATGEGMIVGHFDGDELARFTGELRTWSTANADALSISRDSYAELSKRVGQFKINVDGPEGFAPVLRAVLGEIGLKGPKTVQSDESVMAAAKLLADMVDGDPATALRMAGDIIGNTDANDLAVGMVTLRTLVERQMTPILPHALRDINAYDEIALRALTEDVHRAMSMAQYLQQYKTGLGRGLRSTQIPSVDMYHASFNKVPSEVLEDVPENLIKLPRNLDEMKDFLEVIRETGGNIDALMAAMKAPKTPGRFWYARNAIANHWTANILSSVRTVALNVTNPPLVALERTWTRSSGSFIAALAERDPDKKALLFAAAEESWRAYFSTLNTMFQSLQRGLDVATGKVPAGQLGNGALPIDDAALAFRFNRNVLGTGSSVLDMAANVGPITPELLAASGREKSGLYWLGNVLNMWPRQFQRVNNTLDTLANSLAFNGEAMLDAGIEANLKGLKGAERAAFMQEFVASKRNALGLITDDALRARGEDTTFTGAAKVNWLRDINAGRQAIPELRYIMPVMNIPMNELAESVKRIPGLAFVSPETRKALAGQLGPVAQANAVSRQVMGAAVSGWAWMMAESGALTGAGPRDPRDRAAWIGESLGADGKPQYKNQPYSIRIGDRWYSYAKVPILGYLLGIPAMLRDTTIYRDVDDDTAAKTGAYAAFAVGEFLMQKSVLVSLAEFMGVLATDDENGNKADAWMKKMSLSLAEGFASPGFVKDIARSLDPVKRAPVDIATAFANSFPGTTENVPPLRNIFGEPLHQPVTGGSGSVIPMTIAPISSYDEDPATEEIYRLYKATGWGAGLPAPGVLEDGSWAAKKTRLENGQFLWDRLTQLRMEVTINGTGMRDAVYNLMSAEEYLNGIDGSPSGATRDDAGRLNRTAAMSEVISAYHKAARTQLARESDLAARLLAATDAKKDNPELRDVRTDDIVENPKLLEALGIDLNARISKLKGEQQ